MKLIILSILSHIAENKTIFYLYYLAGNIFYAFFQETKWCCGCVCVCMCAVKHMGRHAPLLPVTGKNHFLYRKDYWMYFEGNHPSASEDSSLCTSLLILFFCSIFYFNGYKVVFLLDLCEMVKIQHLLCSKGSEIFHIFFLI